MTLKKMFFKRLFILREHEQGKGRQRGRGTEKPKQTLCCQRERDSGLKLTKREIVT